MFCECRCARTRRHATALITCRRVCLDAFFEPGLAAWDTAAGALIVREAGGRTTDLDGAAHFPGSPSILASNGLIHDALRIEVRG